MRYIKKYKLFENLESEIDLDELEEVLIDFKQMGLDWDAKVGSSMVINWEKVNSYDSVNRLVHKFSITPVEVQSFLKTKTNNSITIEFFTPLSVQSNQYNHQDTSEGYDMIKDYLFSNYGLIPNYIYICDHWNYKYFQNFEKIKAALPFFKSHHKDDNEAHRQDPPSTHFNAHKLVFGFYSQNIMIK